MRIGTSNRLPPMWPGINVISGMSLLVSFSARRGFCLSVFRFSLPPSLPPSLPLSLPPSLSLTHQKTMSVWLYFIYSLPNYSLLRRRSCDSSRNLSSSKDCKTSHKNVCVGGLPNYRALMLSQISLKKLSSSSSSSLSLSLSLLLLFKIRRRYTHHRIRGSILVVDGSAV